MAKISDNLQLTSQAFERLLARRYQTLLEKSDLLSRDHGFKSAYALNERATLNSALENYQRRFGADVMMLISLETERVQADTLLPAETQMPPDVAFLYETALNSERGVAQGFGFVHGKPYQLVITPLYIPHPVALIVSGFEVDTTLAKALKQVTQETDVALYFENHQQSSQMYACTLAPSSCDVLAGLQFTAAAEGVQHLPARLDGEQFIRHVVPLTIANRNAQAVLLRSLDRELVFYFQLRNNLFYIFLVTVGLSIVGGSILARNVTQPVQRLAAGAERVAEGDYQTKIELPQRDELGRLAKTFNTMMQGLADRERVVNLLGKVVSPQIAEELLNKQIELGGEEREATILFSDVRSFTTLCESLSPKTVIDMLNHYLTAMNQIIEGRNGVVDKYIGDAIMAIYGTPLASPRCAHDAIGAALAMVKALDRVNDEFTEKGWPAFAIGVGINTGVVVAGNMGSMTRLNYTVIGDAVNLASRLEGLCKAYAVPIVVSEFSQQQAPEYVYQCLDKVRVKGKQKPVTIYYPLGLQDDVAPEVQQGLAAYHTALEAYWARDWENAHGVLQHLNDQAPHPLYQKYLERIEIFSQTPPPDDWDGAFTFTSK